MSTTPPTPIATPQPASPDGSGTVSSHLGWSIACTCIGALLCCPTFAVGILAIVYSSRSISLLDMGRIDEARRAASRARIWCIVTALLGCLGLACVVLAITAVGAAVSFVETVKGVFHVIMYVTGQYSR